MKNKKVYYQICFYIKSYVKNEFGMGNIKSLKDVECLNYDSSMYANTKNLDYLDKVELCDVLSRAYNITIKEETIPTITNLAKLAKCVHGLILSKNQQR